MKIEIKSLKFKLVLVLIISGAIIITTISTINLIVSRNQILEQLEDSVRNESESISNRLNNEFVQTESLLYSFSVMNRHYAGRPENQQWTSDYCTKILTDFEKYQNFGITYTEEIAQEEVGRDYLSHIVAKLDGVNPQYVPIEIYNYPGDPGYDPNEFSLDYRDPTSPYYTDFNADFGPKNIGYTPMFYEEVAGVNILSLASITRRNGKPIGFATLDFKVNALDKIIQDSIKNSELPPGTGGLLIADNDRVYVHTLRPDVVEAGMTMHDIAAGIGEGGPELVKEILSGKPAFGVTYAPNLDQDVWFTSTPIEANDFIFLLAIPTKSFYADINRTVLLNIIIGIISLIVYGFISLTIANVIITPILSAVDVTEHISMGDLRVAINTKHLNRSDEIGTLLLSLSKMKKNLVEIVSTVLSSIKEMEAASIMIANDNVDLSDRTEQQASALEETFAAIEEMNGSVKSNADNTQTADKLSREAANKTGAGSSSVTSVIESMNEINASSNRIADIIEVINNIAFQTNLLALNASIEAARAGEQGKGFAVVAVEVRKLAKRSDRAASEISDIIKSSNIKVDQGVEIANRAGEVLDEINLSVKKVTNLVGEISATSQEQLSSVDEIDKTLASLDKNTQMNSQMVEKAAEATEKLSKQARELSQMMDFFKLDGYEHKDSGESYTLLEDFND